METHFALEMLVPTFKDFFSYLITVSEFFNDRHSPNTVPGSTVHLRKYLNSKLNKPGV